MTNPKELTLKIEGMHCASCVAIVEKGLNKLNGVDACRVNLAIHSATVEHNNDITSEKIISEIVELGYKATIGRPDILAANEKEAKLAKKCIHSFIGTFTSSDGDCDVSYALWASSLWNSLQCNCASCLSRCGDILFRTVNNF